MVVLFLLPLEGRHSFDGREQYKSNPKEVKEPRKTPEDKTDSIDV